MFKDVAKVNSNCYVKETNKIKSDIGRRVVLVKRYLNIHRHGGCWRWWLKAEEAMQSFLSYSALPSSLLGFSLHKRNFPKFGSLEFEVREKLKRKKKKKMYETLTFQLNKWLVRA
jgi:hypothetical protein